jgi:inner membrane transporter RhtA
LQLTELQSHTFSVCVDRNAHFADQRRLLRLDGVDTTITQPIAGSREGADTPTRSRSLGMATMLTGATSNQIGAGIGAHAFDAIGPAGVVAVRQVVAAAVLLPVARPPLRRMTWAQWWPTLLLACVFAGMNLALYTAIDRVGLALAVTLEFLGPLVVALAASRNRTDLLSAVAAAAGVYVLVLPGPSSDYLGLGLGLAAGACWAAYILLNRIVGARLPGLQAPAAAAAVCALAYLPVLVVLVQDGRLRGLPLLYAVAAGVLSSVVPYAADLTALRHVPPRFFGVFMSTHPVLAALAGLVLLGQVLALHEWAGIAVVVAANALAVATAGPLHRDSVTTITPAQPRM